MIRNNTHTLDDLIQSLPPGSVITDPASMDAYRWDRANDPDAGVPLAVLRVTSTEEVQAVIRFAAATGTPVVARGAGSGLSGGSTAVQDGIVLSLDRMNSIEIDPITRIAVAGPGAFNAEVKAAAAKYGLWYPPDPSSFEICSIGGNVATNAGGLCCVKYGVTTDYVLGLTVVLGDGRAVRLGGARLKDVAGFSLTKLFVGSEGTLGIITEVLLRLIPEQRPPTTLVASFSSLDSATDAVLAITRSMRPSMLEFMDRVTINAVEDATRMGLDRNAAAMLIAQSDEPAGHAAVEIGLIEDICNQSGATECYATDQPDEGEAFITARRMAIPAVEKRGALLLEDVGVPLPRLGDLVTGIAEISTNRDVTIAVIAHAGDGNTHPLLILDPTDKAQQQRAHIAYGEVMDLAIQLGGTITGEHGVGRLKRPWLADYLGPDVLELNHRIKAALDPQGILNPGVILENRTAH
jgi:glycolate oxidase